MDGRGETFEILVSSAPGGCAELAHAAAKKPGEVRIYACGGDGTLNEVVNGAAEFSNAAVTHFPGGSGNDFVKSFSEQAPFFELPRLLDAEETRLDLIRCAGRYSINVCSMGYDARIGTEIGRYKRMPLVTGKGAYIISAAVNTIRGIHRPYHVEIDGKTYDGEQTLICIGNGRHYGGSFYPLPGAELDDGLLDVVLVRGVSRLTVLRLIGRYAKGGYRELPDLIQFHRCKSVRVVCAQPEAVNLDGELLMEQDVTFQALPQKIRFFYPRGLNYRPKK